MDKICYRITLDAHKGGVQKVLHGFFTGDVSARTIAVSINASGVSCKFGAGTTAIMYVTKENGVTNYGACEVVDNTVYYNVLQADTDCSGIVEMQLKVMNETTVLYAPTFALEVQESKTSDVAAETTPQFSALEAMVAKAQMAYDTRLLSIELRDDLTFVANFADGSVYESDALVRFKDEADDYSVYLNGAIAELNSMKNDFDVYINSALNVKEQAEKTAQYASASAESSKISAEKAMEYARRAEDAAGVAQAVAQFEVDATINANSYNPIANKAVAEALENVNAKTLDGHGAEYFAPFSRINGNYLTTSILEKALDAPMGISEYKLGGDGYNGGDLPHYAWTYGTAIVYKRAANSIVVMLVCEIYDRTLINRYGGTTWTGWVESANTADLANYLPKSGGEVGTDEWKIYSLGVKNIACGVQLRVDTSGNAGLYDTKNGAWLLSRTYGETPVFNGTASGNLPLDGGEIASASQDPLAIKCKQSAYGAYTKYLNADGMLGYLGFNSAGKPIVMPNSWGNSKELLHTGNMADHVLPLDGSKDMTGNRLGLYRGYGFVYTDQSSVGIIATGTESNASDNTNATVLRIVNANHHDTWLSNCLMLRYKQNGVTTDYSVHHDGNSAKVHIGNTAPSDTSALWVY